MDPYQIDSLSKVPAKLKIGFMQFWLAGAVFMITVLGLPQAFDILDRLVVLVLLFTLAMEYGSNSLILWMKNKDFDSTIYLPHEISRKSILSLVATFVYSLIIVVSFHFVLEAWVGAGLLSIGDIISESTADPFSFAIWFLVINSIWIRLRKIIKRPLGRK
jgi:hypothetical protein